MPKAEQQLDLDDEQEPDLAEMKADPERRQHVPYILNGELYRIESQIGDNVTVKCCYCPPDRIYRGSVRSTGNFHMHIKRRHASLLGKLHEMKVAALVERRDRIMKNRRIAKCRKKSTTTPVVAVSALAAVAASVEIAKSTATHELKIKTVFQRHKQEHNEQEEAAAIQTSISVCDSSMDENNSESSDKLSVTPSKQDSNNNNTTATYDNNHKLPDLSPAVASTFVTNPSVGVPMPLSLTPGSAIDLPTMVSIPRMLPLNVIKPEQQNQLLADQPEAIDLSRTSSTQGDEIERSVFTHSVQNVQIGIARTQELAAFVNGPPREILMRIDNTLADIKEELQARNQIERKRLLFDIAKFQFLHPNFNFDTAQ